jgi:UDP-N-acetyl-D-glucosamine dehydrogenase
MAKLDSSRGQLSHLGGHAPSLPARPVARQGPLDTDVAVVGLGQTGLTTALAFEAAGCSVVGVDISPRRLTGIRTGSAGLPPRDRDRLDEAMTRPTFEITGDLSQLARARAVVVCVPTPLDRYRVPDPSMLRRACDVVVAHAVPGQLLVLTSTTHVGCTTAMLLDPLARRGLAVGHDIFVAFSAERTDPGQEAVAQESVPRVVGGATAACVEHAAAVLGAFANDVHCVPSLGTAEMTKLLEHTFRPVDTSLVDELADICRSLDVDVTDPVAAARRPAFDDTRAV